MKGRTSFLLDLSGSGFLPSPCSPRPRPSLALWWRAAFVGLGMMFSMAGAIGETLHIRALKSPEMSSILLGGIRASTLFPFPARIREANASLHAMMGGVPPMIALIEIRRALSHAPNSPALLFWLVYHRIRVGDLIGAEETLEKLKSIGPDWPQTKLLQRWLNAAKGGKEKTP